MRILNKDGQEINTLDFGIVEVGDTKKITCYLENDAPAEVVDIVIKLDHSEVKLVSQPDTLQAAEKQHIEFSWSPTLKEKKGLKTTVTVQASELYKP